MHINLETEKLVEVLDRIVALKESGDYKCSISYKLGNCSIKLDPDPPASFLFSLGGLGKLNENKT